MWSNVYFDKEKSFFYKYGISQNSFMVIKNNLAEHSIAKKRKLEQQQNLKGDLQCCFEINKNDYRKQQNATDDEYIIDLNGNIYAQISKVYIKSGNKPPHKKIIKLKKYIIEEIYGKDTKIAIYENYIKIITKDEVIIHFITQDFIEDNKFINNNPLFSIEKEELLELFNTFDKDSFISFYKRNNRVFKEKKVTIKTVESLYSNKRNKKEIEKKIEAFIFVRKEVYFVLEYSYLLTFIRSKFINEYEIITFYKNNNYIIINERLILQEEKKYLCF